jgi:hypothetical protein
VAERLQIFGVDLGQSGRASLPEKSSLSLLNSRPPCFRITESLIDSMADNTLHLFPDSYEGGPAVATQTKSVQIGKRNQLTLPKEFVSDRIRIFECERLDDGTIVLRPQITVPATQAYFWTPRWQKGEREASQDIAKGRVTRYRKSNDLIKEMDKRRKK